MPVRHPGLGAAGARSLAPERGEVTRYYVARFAA